MATLYEGAGGGQALKRLITPSRTASSRRARLAAGPGGVRAEHRDHPRAAHSLASMESLARRRRHATSRSRVLLGLHDPECLGHAAGAAQLAGGRRSRLVRPSRADAGPRRRRTRRRRGRGARPARCTACLPGPPGRCAHVLTTSCAPLERIAARRRVAPRRADSVARCLGARDEARLQPLPAGPADRDMDAPALAMAGTV
jgi:hypothetical protein